MTLFLLAIFSLLAFALFVLLRPLLRQTQWVPEADEDSHAVTLDLLRLQQTELEQERSLGTLSEEAYAAAHAELQRRLLEELGDEPSIPAPSSAPAKPVSTRRLAFVLMLSLPLFSLLAYVLLGTPAALNPEASHPQTTMTPEKIAAMVERLAQKQRENPNDLDGWLRLAQAYKVMGRFAESAEAYGKAEKKVGADPGLLANYAEVLGMSGPSGMQGKPTELLNAALKLDPLHPHALLMAGVAAMQRHDRRAAIAYWEKLLPQMEEESETKNILRGAIQNLKNQQNTSPAKP